MRDYASLALRLALGLTFLDSVADRFGLLGAPGSAGVSFGTFARFSAYVGVLNWFLPHAVIPALAWIDTALETIFGLALLSGLWLRPIAIASAVLLLTFAITVGRANGLGTAFAYSIFTASAGSWMLAATASLRWSIDAQFQRKRMMEDEGSRRNDRRLVT